MNEWETWQGRTSSVTAYLDPAQANRMAATLDRTPDYEAGNPVPPGWHWLYFHDVIRASQLGDDGHPALGVVMPPVPLAQRMWAAGELAFGGVLRLGTTVTRTSTIREVVSKQGRSGLLYFVRLEHLIDWEGRTRVTEQQTIVYHDLARRPSSETSPPAPADAQFTRRWDLNSTTLFRYSALTFNSHRIHYDADYARDAEGYPALVVHGPLLATLLMDLAQEHGVLSSFSYRARSPLFVKDTVTTNMRPDANAATLWAASPSGGLAMDAQAIYQEMS